MADRRALWILDLRTLDGWREMKRRKLTKTENDRQANQAEGEAEANNRAEMGLQQATVDYYEGRWRDRIKDRWIDITVAIGLYMLIASVAFVVL